MRDAWFTYKGVDFIVEYSGEINEWAIEGLYVDDGEVAQDIFDLVDEDVRDKACEEIEIAIRQEGIE